MARHKGKRSDRGRRQASRTGKATAPGPSTARPAPAAAGGLSFTRRNAVLGIASVVILGLGYWLLSRGDITAAPLLLVLGYVVVVPLAIIRWRN